MKAHTKIYFEHFGIYPGEFVPCEVCGARANDIHHIEARGMGGDPKKKKDCIENLMAVCRACHDKYGDKKQFIEYLKTIHHGKIYGSTTKLA